jgi:two-component system, OmpR family, response regulator
VVEDSERLQRALATALQGTGHAVEVTGDGEEGLWHAESRRFDLVVLDLMLPHLDGLTLLERLRRAGNDVPVLVLTARGTVPDRVLGLRRGADDYLVKPFAVDELLARIEALGRRGPRRPAALAVGPLRVDIAAKKVTRDGVAVTLAPREYAVLECLAQRTGTVVSRSEIEARIYDEMAEPMSNVVDAAVCALRRKLDQPGRPSLIKTRRGMGYVLEAPEDGG